MRERERRERERESFNLRAKDGLILTICAKEKERTNSVTCTYMYYVVTYWPDVYMYGIA